MALDRLFAEAPRNWSLGPFLLTSCCNKLQEVSLVSPDAANCIAYEESALGRFLHIEGRLMQIMGSLHTHALFPHGTGPYSARWNEEARAAPSAGNIRALCIRNRPIAP